MTGCAGYHFRAKRGEPETFQGIYPGSQGQNLAVTVSYVPYSLEDAGALAIASVEERTATLEATEGQILSQSPTDATRFWWHL